MIADSVQDHERAVAAQARMKVLAAEKEAMQQRIQDLQREKDMIAAGYEEQKRKALEEFELEKQQILESYQRETAQLQSTLQINAAETALKQAEIDAAPVNVEVEVDPTVPDDGMDDWIDRALVEAGIDFSEYPDIYLLE